MAAPNDNLCQEYEKQFRLITLIDLAGRYLCYEVLLKKEKLPTDGALLYTELKNVKSKIRFKDQIEVAFSTSGITDYKKFDLTLLASAIQSKFGDKYETLVGDLRNAQNKEFHRGNKTMSYNEFENLWNETKNMLENHGFDMKLVRNLTTSDPFSYQRFKDAVISSFLGSADRTNQSKLDQLKFVESSL